MDCSSIRDVPNLVLDAESVQAIQSIRERLHEGRLLQMSLGAGVLVALFLGSHPIDAAMAVRGTDFESLAKAMSGVPTYTRRRVSDIAAFQWLRVTDWPQKLFWKAVHRGCMP